MIASPFGTPPSTPAQIAEFDQWWARRRDEMRLRLAVGVVGGCPVLSLENIDNGRVHVRLRDSVPAVVDLLRWAADTADGIRRSSGVWTVYSPVTGLIGVAASGTGASSRSPRLAARVTEIPTGTSPPNPV